MVGSANHVRVLHWNRYKDGLPITKPNQPPFCGGFKILIFGALKVFFSGDAVCTETPDIIIQQTLFAAPKPKS